MSDFGCDQSDSQWPFATTVEKAFGRYPAGRAPAGSAFAWSGKPDCFAPCASLTLSSEVNQKWQELCPERTRIGDTNNKRKSAFVGSPDSITTSRSAPAFGVRCCFRCAKGSTLTCRAFRTRCQRRHQGLQQAAAVHKTETRTWRNGIMKTSKTQEGPRYTDTFIREVRANYQQTASMLFTIKGPNDVADFVRSVLTDNSREHCVALYLDGAHQVVSYSIISIGTANMSVVHPREVFQRAILAGAISIIIAHNHPSGVLTPSDEDHKVTQRLKDAGEILGIKLLDHVIVTDVAQRSIRESELA